MRVPEWFRLPELLRVISNELRSIRKRLNTMAITVAGLTAEMAAIRAFLEEAQAELTTKIADQEAEIAALEESLATAGTLSQEAQDHIAAVRAISESMAGVVPNAPPPVEPVE